MNGMRMGVNDKGDHCLGALLKSSGPSETYAIVEREEHIYINSCNQGIVYMRCPVNGIDNNC